MVKERYDTWDQPDDCTTWPLVNVCPRPDLSVIEKESKRVSESLRIRNKPASYRTVVVNKVRLSTIRYHMAVLHTGLTDSYSVCNICDEHSQISYLPCDILAWTGALVCVRVVMVHNPLFGLHAFEQHTLTLTLITISTAMRLPSLCHSHHRHLHLHHLAAPLDSSASILAAAPALSTQVRN